MILRYLLLTKKIRGCGFYKETLDHNVRAVGNHLGSATSTGGCGRDLRASRAHERHRVTRHLRIGGRKDKLLQLYTREQWHLIHMAIHKVALHKFES